MRRPQLSSRAATIKGLVYPTWQNRRMLRSPLAIVRRLPPPVPVLIVGTFINKAGSFILPYLTLVLAREFRLDEKHAAGLVMVYGVGSLASILAGGYLTDRMGRRRTLLLSLFG